ncbi:hypothetical protein SmJEL517_g02321 [Synchytrium microbalum]|uniref:Palmitoyltransferase n=1 Tax=Synchytrium microbalum TaxID=1806994 RepID=A0A507C7U6_9FUNG|nr:uncharacterized protein SmJEL517_g02321 [Synchytrium microbalum]TPX35219.1 hypothetical protein SmJEL517_g02321 [Synchytrium microbalum]
MLRALDPSEVMNEIPMHDHSSHSHSHKHHGHSHHDGHNHSHGHGSPSPPPTDPAAPSVVPVVPVDELNLFQAAQRGATDRIAQLIEQGLAKATDLDAEKCTALHWAAINNQLIAAKYLVDQGAIVDAPGGDLQATPLHWAARTGHVQMVTFLWKKGADPTKYDNQGYNALHLAAHEAHPMMMVFLISIGMDVDSSDQHGRSGLVWVCYQGKSLDCLEVLIRYKASLDKADSTGFTPLHWAVVAQKMAFARRLLVAGARTDIPDPKGQTPGDWAKERNMEKEWKTLVTRSRQTGWLASQFKMLDKDRVNTMLYLVPFIAQPIIMGILSYYSWYIAFPASFAFALLVFHQVVTNGLIGRDADLIGTPFLTAIPQASSWIVGFTWIFRVLPYSGFLTFYHIAFLCLFTCMMYTFYMAIFTDPGYIEYTGSEEDKKKLVITLAESGLLDHRHYCVVCCIRKPLRSKHCKHCDKCVAQFDHHCPWTNNCIGVKNHRYFMQFLVLFFISAVTFAYIGLSYVSAVTESLVTAECGTLCTWMTYDAWTMWNVWWCILNSLWTIILFMVQSYQVSVAKTTNETANWHRYDYLVHPEDVLKPLYMKRMFNPFDKGVLKNCIGFWKGPEPGSRISHLYELNERQGEGEKDGLLNGIKMV